MGLFLSNMWYERAPHEVEWFSFLLHFFFEKREKKEAAPYREFKWSSPSHKFGRSLSPCPTTTEFLLSVETQLIIKTWQRHNYLDKPLQARFQK